MATPSQTLRLPPYAHALPAQIVFRAADMPAHATYPRHRHAWGEFVCAYSGVMEVQVSGRHHLAPAHCGIWLPPHTEHVGLNRLAASHCSVYIAAPRCALLPAEPCALSVSPLLRGILEHLRRHPGAQPATVADERLLQVLLDQLELAPCARSELPGSQDPVLAPVLQALQADPGDSRTLAELARGAHTTERTLARRCQRELGMSFAEWRQRLRAVRALPLLLSGQKVESVALELGYRSASAFISMFARLMGVTPDDFRKGRTEAAAPIATGRGARRARR
jgi:AraC-like DNA-binding protein